MKISPRIKKEMGISKDYVWVSGDEKIEVKKKVIKISKNKDWLEKAEVKKLALFLDKKSIRLLKNKSFINKEYLITKNSTEINLLTSLRNHLFNLKHDDNCTKSREYVILINPKIKPNGSSNCSKMNDKQKWYKEEEMLLRNLKRVIFINGLQIRDLVSCNLVPNENALIVYEKDALWTWFDAEIKEEDEESFLLVLKYCIKVMKRCIFPFLLLN
ncbi:MAG: hypothetical protein mread185_000140 [Mycoplasmataceae bacterium]|nr:MAG: hypothetical protein mread185_000140 [Mycoplasmataceae bacterium]